MPAGSSDGSLSRATSASSPVLTSGRARGPDAQRATVWSKNGSTKRSAERSAQSTAGAGPEKSSRIGVQRARSASSIGRWRLFGISCRAAGRGIRSRSAIGPARSAVRIEPGQIANPKRLGAFRDEQHRGLVVGAGGYRQTRKLQRNAVGNRLHPRIERLVLPHQRLFVDSGGVRDWSTGGHWPRRTKTSANKSRPPAMALGSSTVLTASRTRTPRVACMSASSRCRGGSSGVQTVVVETPRIKRPDGKHERRWARGFRRSDGRIALSLSRPHELCHVAHTARRRLPGASRSAPGGRRWRPPCRPAATRAALRRRRCTNARSWIRGSAGSTRRGRRSGERAPVTRAA